MRFCLFLKRFFPSKAIVYVAFTVLFGVGVVVGIFYADSIFDGFISNYFEEYFLLVFNGGGLFSLFLSRVVNNLALCVIFSTPYLLRGLIALPIFATAYRGYVFGTTLSRIVCEFGVSGVLLSAFLIIPVQFLLQFCLCSLSLASYSFGRSCKRGYFSVFGFYFASSLLVALLEIVIIGVVIRPLSFVV